MLINILVAICHHLYIIVIQIQNLVIIPSKRYMNVNSEEMFVLLLFLIK